MLGKIRKFSSTILAKVFLFIIAIPFVFWGMGDLFRSGNQNTIVKIDDKNIPTKEFVEYVNIYTSSDQKINDALIEKLLRNFIGEKLLVEEIEDFDFKLSDNSLREIITNEEAFKKNNLFSRTEYEKFLVKNSLNAVIFENNLSMEEKKRQLLNYIGGGIAPSNYFVNIVYNEIKQKRNVQIINLNDIFEKEIKFTDDQIKNYFEKNKSDFEELYKTFKLKKLTPKNLTANDNYTDLFFKKIDEIDDMIVQGKKLSNILSRFDLENIELITTDKIGRNKQFKKIENYPNDLVLKIFDINKDDPLLLIEHKDTYFIVNLVQEEMISKKISDVGIKNKILLNLGRNVKREFFSSIISKINNNEFKKIDFDKMAKVKNVEIKKINLDGRNDNKLLKKELVAKIYSSSPKNVIAISDIGLTENYLVYIDSVKNVNIDKNSEDYKKYYELSKLKITENLYSSYNHYLEKKYNIDINYNALNTIKNYTR